MEKMLERIKKANKKKKIIYCVKANGENLKEFCKKYNIGLTQYYEARTNFNKELTKEMIDAENDYINKTIKRLEKGTSND